MKWIVLDVESTIKNSGHPFTKSNKLCAVGLKDSKGTTVYRIEHGLEPYGEALKEIKHRLERADYVVGFNIKFDLHWIRRYIGDVDIRGVFDCQLAEFLLCGQVVSYPALGETAARYGLGTKLDLVSREYWNLGINTDAVPWEILSEYCASDVELTDKLHLKQRELFTPLQKKLFWLQCEDLLLLEEMEWNGLRYDFKAACAVGQELQQEEAKIDEELRSIVGVDCVDFGSSDHLSVVLYGGTIWERYRESYTRTLKDGTEKSKERWSVRPVEFRRMVKPLRGSETKPTSAFSDADLESTNRTRISEGKIPYVRHWSVSEPVLTKLVLKGKAKRIVELILRRSRIRKLDSTYYTGLAAKHDEMEWPEDMIHGQFNQCVARTGRLSSSEPNEQNFDKDIKKLFYSRYQ